MNLYVGNLAKTATDDDLWEAFNIYADETNITVVKDRMTGEPLGYAFLEIPVKMEALIAMKEMNGKEICGQAVVVNEARPRRRSEYRDRPPRDDRDWRERPPRDYRSGGGYGPRKRRW